MGGGGGQGWGRHHPTVFRPQATKTVSLIHQPTNQLVREGADLSTSAENLILVLVSLSRSSSGGEESSPARPGPPLLLTGGCYGDLLLPELLAESDSAESSVFESPDHMVQGGGGRGERTFLHP